MSEKISILHFLDSICFPLKLNFLDLNETQEYFQNLKNNQINLKPINGNNFQVVDAALHHRKSILKSLKFICSNYYLREETLFKAIQLFDLYFYKEILNKINGKNLDFFQNENETENLLIHSILCLNIACKFEEVNCNYLKFFKENIIKSQSKLTIKELFIKETNLLLQFNFRISMPTPFEFSCLFLQMIIQEIVSFHHSNSTISKEDITVVIKRLIIVNDKYLKYYFEFTESIFNTSSTISLICLKAALLNITQSLKVDLGKLMERINMNLLSILKSNIFLRKVDIEAFKIFCMTLNIINL